jgi:hypothetical protein
MKNILLINFWLIFPIAISAQSISCQELYEGILDNASKTGSVSCYGSDALVKAEYYTYDNEGYVIIYFKNSTFDTQGSPYVFCGISSYKWSSFKASGISGWGEAYHEYIKNYRCNCS